MVNEETFKQIYAQFFPHGGESDLETDPSWLPLFIPWQPSFLQVHTSLLSASSSRLGRTSRIPPLLQGVEFTEALAEKSSENGPSPREESDKATSQNLLTAL